MTTEASHPLFRVLTLAGLLLTTTLGCNDDFDEDVYYYPYDYYDYAYYYPADLYYSDLYYADDYYYSPYYYYSGSTEQPLADSSNRTLGVVLRAVASGDETICPGQVTLEPTNETLACPSASGTSDLRTGARVTFDNCVLASGERIDGVVQVQSTHEFTDENCDASTLVTVTVTSSYENLSFTKADGSRSVVPSMTHTASYSRLYGSPPVAVSTSGSGTLELYDAAGSPLTQLAVQSSQGLVLGSDPEPSSYRVYGVVRVTDQNLGQAATLSGSDILHQESCCQPTAGELTVSAEDGRQSTLSFGPECGQASQDGELVTLQCH